MGKTLRMKSKFNLKLMIKLHKEIRPKKMCFHGLGIYYDKHLQAEELNGKERTIEKEKLKLH